MTGVDDIGAAPSSDADTGGGADVGATTQDRPLLRFTGGNPTPAEVAVITAVIVARGSGSGDEAPVGAERSLWGRPAHVRRMRPRSWAESRLPR